ncbi:hypothetical protein DSM112329_02335 [Paraconexibacter sp. AEG42_29]|uniref:Uncharacterized protein n=1 Tax=Paraconexibacter sp. AEG42_29 TaxID=2997339 RepID=A0AAU7AV34_9ACTN
MTFVLLMGYIPLMIALVVVGLWASSRTNQSADARALGDRIGRRSGLERRSSDLAFVGNDRRSGVDRRSAEAAQAERAA